MDSRQHVQVIKHVGSCFIDGLNLLCSVLRLMLVGFPLNVAKIRCFTVWRCLFLHVKMGFYMLKMEGSLLDFDKALDVDC